MNEVLRQEKKYLLSYDQFRRLDHTFEQVLHPDPSLIHISEPTRLALISYAVNDTATTEIYTILFVGSVICV